MSGLKICGVNDPDFAREAEALGADYLGLIFAPGSPRMVSVDAAREICRGLKGTAKKVGVFTTTSAEVVLATARRLDLDVIQLHRRAEAWDIQLLRDAGYEVWALAGGAEADGLLFDSSHGDGETKFRRGPWKTILAGGISKDNLASALVFNPDVVDVSGSLETEPGQKSVELLREFFAEWKARTDS